MFCRISIQTVVSSSLSYHSRQFVDQLSLDVVSIIWLILTLNILSAFDSPTRTCVPVVFGYKSTPEAFCLKVNSI